MYQKDQVPITTKPSEEPPIIEWTKNFYIEFGFESLNILLIALCGWGLGYLNSLIKQNRSILSSLNRRKRKEILDDEKLANLRYILTSVNNKSKAERTIFLLSHNGETFLDRISYVKSTAVMEVCEPDKIKISKHLLGIPQTLLHTDSDDITFNQDFLSSSYSFELMMSNRVYSPNSIFLESGSYGYALLRIPNFRDMYSSPIGYLLLTFEKKEYEAFKIGFDLSHYQEDLQGIIKIISSKNLPDSTKCDIM